MKRRYLLNAIPRCPSAVVFAGFLWAATIACAGPGQAQTFTKPDAATPRQTEVQAAQNTPKKTPAPSGAWHHFGESDKASGAGQSQPGVWHAFGPNPGTPKVGREAMAPGQDFGADRRADLERQMWALVNQDRLDPETAAETGGRAQPLRWNENLAAVARAHSRDMLEQRFFDHVDLEGRTPSARINEAGIPWRASGENIAIYPTVLGAEGAFMNEPRFQHNHRSNILNANYTDVGIGIVQGANGSLYITQDFVATLANGAGVVSAPRPTYQPQPGYTPAARKAQIEGEVALSIVIDARGNVTQVKQTSDPLGAGLDESAAATVRTWKFEPAKRDGVPVAVKRVVKVTFKLFA
jgi:TonB family protein